jgi:hypothetical protein
VSLGDPRRADDALAAARSLRPEPGDFAPYYAGYIEQVPDGDIVATLRAGRGSMERLLGAVPAEQEGHRYAPGKWSVREVMGHLTDTERVFASRLVWFARGDPGPLPGMDQDAWVEVDSADARPLSHHLEEWSVVRSSVVLLLEGLDLAAWQREGTASGGRFTVRALAWVIAGHARHHERLFVERYGLNSASPG